jgi:hypothetical protein
MLDETKEVLDDNDTGKEETLSTEKSEDDTFEVPTIDPDSEEAKTAAVKKDTTDEDDRTWKERYTFLQGQKDKEVSAAQKEVTRYKKLLAPYEKNIVEKDGDLDFNFADTPDESKVEAEKEPQPPTDDEWATNPTAAAEKLYEYKEYKRQQKELAKQEEQETAKAETDYKKGRQDGWTQAQEMFPDIKDKESALFKRADEILKADPRLADVASCDLIAVKLAALDLGIRPVKGSVSKKDSSYIISGKTGKSGKGSDSGKLTPEEFDSLPTDKQDAIMEKEILGKGE